MSRRRVLLDLLDDWPMPFLWLLLIPVVTVPLTFDAWLRALRRGACVRLTPESAFAADFGCPPDVVLWAHSPGLLNLVPAFWLLSSRRRVRLAARWATGLGALRLVAPVALLGLAWPGPNLHGANGIGHYPPGSAVLLSLALWLLSGAVAGVFRARTRGPGEPRVARGLWDP